MADLASLLTPGSIVHNTNNNEEKDETVSGACDSYSYQSWSPAPLLHHGQEN